MKIPPGKNDSNEVVSYDTLTLTYLLIVGIVAQAVGIAAYWWLQKGYQISAKMMFNMVMVAIVVLDGWGMVGNWTDNFGFHHVWEIWLYQAFYGLFVCQWYSYSQVSPPESSTPPFEHISSIPSPRAQSTDTSTPQKIIISSVTPRGHEFLFFSLFTVIGKTSSFIGPFVSSAIIDASPGGANNSAPFYFLFALTLVSALGLWLFLDLEQSAREQEAFLARQKASMTAADSE
ncbi:hypothetical protein NUW58_g1291 [Xylaria curta]|uniref:Uncharacterized protein n=1 Tax=Xylaria curta TaxID=42375 RepID=A0ACC1PM24_9PEZI|nr:hypothetical protein NUW58_g1291 [Xylaria curta]